VNPDVDLLIIGAGAIGLACAWRAAEGGLRVRVVERDRAGAGASGAAAGLLSPTDERQWTGSGAPACFAAMRAWAAFSEQLADAAGRDPGYRSDGSLRVANDADGERALHAVAGSLHTHGIEHALLDGGACAGEEPGLRSPHAGLAIPGDAHVDSGRLVTALRVAAAAAGATLSQGVEPVSACMSDHRLEGVSLSDGTMQPAAMTVLATGAWSSQAAWLPVALRPPVRPVAGEYLILRGEPARPVCRQLVVGGHGVVAPRSGGHYWAGTTVRESGYDTRPRADCVAAALRHAAGVLPAIGELGIARVGVGLRPATPDGAAVVGLASLPGLAYATGHGREGIVLTPFTADAIVALAVDSPLPEAAAPLAPARFGL
jgi:glycine oxidase